MAKTYNILVPYDFDDASKNALKHAGIIAAKKNAQITVLHVVDSGEGSSFHATGVQPADPAFQVAMIRMVEKLKKRLNLEIPTLVNMKFLKGIQVKAAQFEHTVSDIILKQPTDLIVMGTKGFHGSKELFISSLTQVTVDKSKVPVIVVKKDTPISKYDHVVYASHFEETHTDEMTQLAEFLNQLGANIDLVKVTGNGSLDNDTQKRLQDVAHSLQFNEANADAEIVRSKDVEDAIQLYLEKKKADLLTVNAHRIGGVGRFFGDNTVEHLVNSAEQPIMLLNINSWTRWIKFQAILPYWMRC